MIQKHYKVSCKEEFSNVLQEIKHSDEFKKSKTILFKAFTILMRPDEISDMIQYFHQYFQKSDPLLDGKDIHMVGMSLGFIRWIIERQKEEEKSCLLFNITFLDSSEVKIMKMEFNQGDTEESYRKILDEVQKDKEHDLKGMEILSSGTHPDLPKMIDEISGLSTKTPLFGAEAGIYNYDPIKGRGIQFSFADGKIFQSGIVLIIYLGKDLHIKADYLFGWVPQGKEFTVTKMKDYHCVETIDDLPASDIYRKYLGVDTDEYFILNTVEFPFVIHRNGCSLGRVSPKADLSKRLYFVADIQEGEKIRLSYGNTNHILKNTYAASEDMANFQAESVSLYICGNRSIFLKEDAEKEIDSYRRNNENLCLVYGTAEIYRLREQGGILNSSLIAVGMREGEKKKQEESLPSGWTIDMDEILREENHREIPISSRLATFLTATTKDLKINNNKLKHLAEKAQVANVAKSAFLSNMSHEIRTPINAIMGMNQMILRESREPSIMEYAKNAKSASENLLGLVNDILDFSKIEAGKLDIIPVDYRISSLLGDIVTMIRKRAEDKGLNFLVEADKNLPLWLHGDEIRIKQIILNILTNAVKYTETGNVTLRCKLLSLNRRIATIHVSVRDTGIGIKEEDMEKLFVAFERIEEGRNRNIEGTGLGMNITTKLLHLMKSELKVKSEYGKGSEFSFTIMQERVRGRGKDGTLGEWSMEKSSDKEDSMDDIKETMKCNILAPSAKVLMIDDTPMNQMVFKGLLKPSQIQIDSSLDGKVGLSLASQNKYDIIFIDHRMKGWDGIKTLKKIKEEAIINKDTPTVSLTANAVSGAREEYIKAGFDDYLSKPIDSKELEKLISEYLPKEKLKISEAGTNHHETKEDAETIEILKENRIDGNDSSGKKEDEEHILEKLSFLNTETGIRNCSNRELYLDALQIYHGSLSENISELEHLYKEKDLENYTIKIHAMKSSSRIIGAEKISALAMLLEDAGNEDDTEFIDSNHHIWIRRATLLKEKLDKVFSPLPSCAGKPMEKSSKPKISKEEWEDALASMKEFTTSFDDDSLSFILDSLDDYQLSPEESSFVEQVKFALKSANWESLRKLLS